MSVCLSVCSEKSQNFIFFSTWSKTIEPIELKFINNIRVGVWSALGNIFFRFRLLVSLCLSVKTPQNRIFSFGQSNPGPMAHLHAGRRPVHIVAQCGDSRAEGPSKHGPKAYIPAGRRPVHDATEGGISRDEGPFMWSTRGLKIPRPGYDATEDVDSRAEVPSDNGRGPINVAAEGCDSPSEGPLLWSTRVPKARLRHHRRR